MKLNLSSAVRSAKTIVTANSPALLVGTAIAGVVATGVLAAKGGYKARGIVDFHETQRRDDTLLPPLTVQDKARLTWKCYLIPGITGVSTIASIVGVHTIHTKRHAAMAGLYAVTATKLDDYREQAEELLGPKKSQELTDKVAQKRAAGRGPHDHHQVLMIEGGTELVYDDWSGRYFMGSVPIVEAAFANVNLQLAQDGEVSLNDFYDFVGLPPIPMGVEFGWSGKSGVEARWVSNQPAAPDGRAVIEYSFSKEPKSKLGVV